MTVLTTENEGYGFYGTMWTAFGSEITAQRAWPIAFAAVRGLTGMSPEDVRIFLDSRHGRYLADSVVTKLGYSDEAVLAAVLEHNSWTHKGENYIVRMTKLCKLGK